MMFLSFSPFSRTPSVSLCSGLVFSHWPSLSVLVCCLSLFSGFCSAIERFVSWLVVVAVFCLLQGQRLDQVEGQGQQLTEQPICVGMTVELERMWLWKIGFLLSQS